MYSVVTTILNICVKRVCLAVCVLGALAGSSVYAGSLSTYRIYLDDDSRTASFVVFNKTAVPEECALSFRHNDFDEKGDMFRVQEGVIPENSAQPWIRYSPQKFEIPAGVSQTIRFTLRRKANAKEGEYRSYLLIDCVSIAKATGVEGSASLMPHLVHNVPIIVRHGALSAELKFENIQIESKRVTFDLVRSGNRSTYGELQLFNTKTDEIVSFMRNISIYPEFTRASHKLEHKGVDVKDLELRFIEDDRYGGSINLTYPLHDK